MAEPKYMLMVLADSNPTGERFWAAVNVSGRGRALTRQDAFVMDLGGKRHGKPPFYEVPLVALGVG